ncbi:MAG: DUF1254 domain-containing protein [Nitrososphaerota archaeon]
MTTMRTAKAQSLSVEEAYDIGVEAYIYLYPLVLMELTRRQMTNCPPDERPGFGPANMFIHARTFPPADFRAVVRPNFDTLYSIAWLDLTDGPMIMSVPDTHGRYYLVPLLDMWTDVFAAPGKRTSGTQPADFAIVPPGWSGTLPHGVRHIAAPTPYVWIIGRIQTNGAQDYDAVHRVQDGCRLTPLAEWGATPRPAAPVPPDPRVDMTTPPLEQVAALSATDFFALAAKLIEQHPPHLTDWSTLVRMERIGLTVGKPFDRANLLPPVAQALEPVPADALRFMRAKMPTLARMVNGWQMDTETMGTYGNFYAKRAIVAMLGLGANQPADAIYPLNVADAAGQTVNGDHDYAMHFSKEELPPVEAFWSLTMYDAEGFQAANQLNRFALGDRDPLVYNADGSLDLYVQHDHPGRDKEANWLPAPHGPLGLTLRLYAPKPQALDGRWNPPAVTRVR